MTRTAPIAAAAILFALAAQASDDDRAGTGHAPPRAEWMSVADLAGRLEAQGYTIHELEAERSAWEVEMTDANGMTVKAYLHPVTGEVLPDDDYHGDDD